MERVGIIGLDLAKRRLQAHGARADGGVAFRKTLSRDNVLTFLAEHPGCVVAMEACGSAHHWGRAIGALGHEVRLIPPALCQTVRQAPEERRGGCRSHL
jgi:transposase